MERIPGQHRAAIIEELRSKGLLEVAVPDELLAVLRQYQNVPGAWLLLEPMADRTPALDANEALSYLARAFPKAIGNSHRKALVLFPPLQWLCYRQKISVTPDMGTAFDKFSRNQEDQDATDASIRSSAMLMDRGPFEDASITAAGRKWAKSFWHQNWHMTECQPAEFKDEPTYGGVDDRNGGGVDDGVDRVHGGGDDWVRDGVDRVRAALTVPAAAFGASVTTGMTTGLAANSRVPIAVLTCGTLCAEALGELSNAERIHATPTPASRRKARITVRANLNQRLDITNR